MTCRSNGSKFASGLAVAFVLLTVAACGSGKAGGPLRTVTAGAQPGFAVESGLTSPDLSVDATAYVVNSAPDPVTLVSASLIPIPGHQAGRLVLLRFSADGDGGGGRGWPVPGLSAGPFRGARVRHGESSVIFGFAGTRPGVNYMTAGLRTVYRYHGRLYTGIAWSAAAACVSPDWRTGDLAACGRAEDVVRRATEHLAGVS